MTGPEAKSCSFLTASEASQTEQTEVHGKFSETALKVRKEYIRRGEDLPPVQLAQGSALPSPTSQTTTFKAKDRFCGDHYVIQHHLGIRDI